MSMLRYNELITFEPVESVVKLREANDNEKAIQLLHTYVISDNMADRLIHDIFEQLQYDRIVDNKGLLIVGNYGSGKSHLMSVISTIAEMEGATNYIKNIAVAEKAKEIEGKFKVIRAEFGAVTMSLRDIICQHLEDGLSEMGIDYTFPSVAEVTNNKDMLFEMMELFHEEYPEQGLMLVIDELLDYLRGRKEQELTLDLGFLREIGEVCQGTRFRFISGVQEMLFDNPKFSFVADSLRRVKERFHETRIVREDIAYVVSERLLKKDDQQKALIREHLSKFTKLYDGLSEQMEEYVNMFPIHPAYLEMFEQVSIGEQRVALQTITNEIKKLHDNEVPTDSPGFVSFDRYWTYIEGDSSLKSNARVKTVMEKVITLRGTIQAGVKRPYQAMANQIVNALAVFRLTTDDLKIPIGLTSETLRDKLFLIQSIILDFEDDAANTLKTSIESVIKNIREAASFQFISVNESNNQYFINIDESIPVDELISQRGEGLSDHQLDTIYFDILKKAMEVTDVTTYVQNYKIWLHELPWMDRRVKRQGYLFFGAPNERSTAQPERDFYIYMLQAFEIPKFKDEEKEDEVFFKLKDRNEEFVELLRKYGGAVQMSNDTSTNKKLYTEKVSTYQKGLIKWLRDNLVHAYEVIYKGKTGSVLDHGFFLPQNPDTLVEVIDSVSQDFLSEWFAVKYPDYPTFRKLERTYLTKENLHTYVKDALEYLNGKRTSQGEVLLDGLVLLDEQGNTTTRKTERAKWIVDLLADKEKGQVLNQNELIEVISTSQGSPDKRLTKKYDLEPELLVVILGALIIDGKIVVTVEGTQYEAMNFSEFIQIPVERLTYFSHIKEPTGLPVGEIQALLNLFDPRQINFSKQDNVDFAIKDIIKNSRIATENVVEMLANLDIKFQIWDGLLFTDEEMSEIKSKLSSLNEFLQRLQVHNTRAKMMNLKFDMTRIEEEQENLGKLEELINLQGKINDYRIIADYLVQAKLIVSPNSTWNEQVDIVLDNLSLSLKNNKDCSVDIADLERLKKEYIDYYFDLHQKKRLNATEEKKKAELLQSNEFRAIKMLADGIEILPDTKGFLDWENKLKQFKVCYHLTQNTLQNSPQCNICNFNPREEGIYETQSVSEMADDLHGILDIWTDSIVTNFNDPLVQESIELLDAKQKELIHELIERKAFKLPISYGLIQTINTVMKGIHKEQLSANQIMEVFGDGNPLTVKEIEKNIKKLLNDIVGNSNQDRVRIIVKK